MRKFLPLLAIPAAAALFLSLTGQSAAEPTTKKAKDYEISAAAADVKSGAEGTYTLVIKPLGKKTLKLDTPLKVKLKSDEGIDLAKKKLGKADVTKGKDDKGAKTLEAKFSAKKEGTHKIDADATFFLCDEKACSRFKEKVSVPVKVAAGSGS